MEPTDQLGRQPADHLTILRVIASHEARFLLAGGMAVQAHGYLRSTLDVDIIPRPDEANMTLLARALDELEATAVDDRGRSLPLDLSHPASLAVGNYFLETRAGALDLFNGPRPDLKLWTRMDESAIELHIEEFTLRAIGIDDLLRMKREAGREKDLADIAALTEVERARASD